MIKDDYYIGEYLRDSTGFRLIGHRKKSKMEDFVLNNFEDMPTLETFERLADSFYTKRGFKLRPFGKNDELISSPTPKTSLLVYEKREENLCLQISFSHLMNDSELVCSVVENNWHLSQNSG